MDQDHVTFSRMATLGNVYNTVTKVRNLRGEQIHSMTEAESKLIQMLRDEGIIK